MKTTICYVLLNPGDKIVINYFFRCDYTDHPPRDACDNEEWFFEIEKKEYPKFK
jgi:hypothetical protein